MKVFSATFAYGGLEPWTVACRDRDHHLMGVKLTVASSDLDAERGRCFTRFLRSGCDVALFIDRDMAWSPESIPYVTQAAMHTKGIVSGLYAQKERGRGWCANLPDGFPLEIGADKLLPLKQPWACGAGFLAFHREAAERLAELEPLVEGDYHPVFAPMIIESTPRRRLPEDFSFFWRAQSIGVPTDLALLPILDHYGTARYTAMTAHAAKDEEISPEVGVI